MRPDMYKVIVERPRRGGSRAPARRVDDLEASPAHEGLRQRHRHRKWLNENLRPLERYLAQQTGRPWDKVYAEICARIDRRNTVQQHIHEHLQDFVALRVFESEGRLYSACRSGDPEPLERYYGAKFYVCPRSGLLRENVLRARARHEWRQCRRKHDESTSADRRVLDAARQLHRIDGLWYAIDVARVGDAARLPSPPLDVLRGLPPDRCPAWNDAKGVASNRKLLGDPDLYAWRKRQLGRTELRAHGLANVPA